MMRVRAGALLRSAGLILALAAGAPAQDAPLPSAPLFVPLFVEEPGTSPRVGEFVRSGIPLPQSANVTDADTLRLLRRDGAGDWSIEVPLQARTTSRWDGTVSNPEAPAKWVLLDFPATVERGGRREYRLSLHESAVAGGAGRPPPTPDWIASDRGDRFAVDTGALRFEIRKDRFGLFENMNVRSAGEGGVTWRQTTDGGAFRVVLEDGDGEVFTPSFATPREVVVEESGPLLSVFRIRGAFANARGERLKDGWIAYTIRLHVYAGSTFVRLFFTLENDGLYGLEADRAARDDLSTWLLFDRLSLDFTSRFEGETQLDTGALRERVGEDGRGTFRLYQGHEIRSVPEGLLSEAGNFFYELRVDGRTVRRGARSPGAARVKDGTRSVTVAVRHFWQSHPKAISFENGRLSVELWPREGHWPDNLAGRAAGTYQFEGGRHKTFELGFDFGAAGGMDPVDLAATLGRPLFAMAPAEWYARSGALDFMAPEVFPVANRAVATALRRFNRMHEAFVDATRAEVQRTGGAGARPPMSIQSLREQRGNVLRVGAVARPGHAAPAGHRGRHAPVVGAQGVDMYGWFSFGDLPHHRGWSSLHHDWPYGMLLQFLRHGGKHEFLFLGEEMVRHRYDIDQYHHGGRNHEKWWRTNGFQRFDRGWHGDYERSGSYSSEAPPSPGATWLEGLLLHHRLTGDPRSLEAARENADAFYEFYRLEVGVTDHRVPVLGPSDLRDAAMAMKGLLEFHLHTGEMRYRDMAWDIYANHVRYSEELAGNGGTLFRGARQEMEPLVLLLEPLRKLHMVVQDPGVLSLLARILHRLRKVYLDVSGYGDLDRYMPLQLPRVVGPDGVSGSEMHYGFRVADAFAYLHLTTREESSLDFARWLFRDSVLYFQAPAFKLVRPDFVSSISYPSRRDPARETVANAAVMTGHQVYLTAEWSRSLEGATPFRFPHNDLPRPVSAETPGAADDRFHPAHPWGEVAQRGRASDATPPRVTVKGIRSSDDRAVITVVTDEWAAVRIEFGADARQTRFTPRPFRAGTIHEIELPDLEPNRTWHFRVHAVDLAGNWSRTGFASFRSAPDVLPPRVTRVSSPEDDRVVVEFSEPVDPRDAWVAANYRIGGVTVFEAVPDPSGRRVDLHTGELARGRPYEIRVTGLRDLTRPPNRIEGPAADSALRFYRDITADDGGSAFRVLSGSWERSEEDRDARGGGVHLAWTEPSDGALARAQWTVPVPEDGTYEVYVRCPRALSSREVATRVPYRVHYRGGSATVTVNQRMLGGRWVRLATMPFSARDGVRVTVSTEGSDGAVLADAVRVVYMGSP